MAEFNGAYKQARYEKMSLNRVHVMSNIKVFAMQDDQPARWTHKTHSIDPYDSHMDQNASSQNN